MIEMEHVAEGYTNAEFAVFPLWWVDGGRCACGKPDCSSPGKHPIGEAAPRGCLDASSDEARVRAWWARWPRANIGLPTGLVNRVVVLDVDPANGGNDALERLMDRHGDLSGAWVVETGGGGLHLYFARPTDRPVRNSASAVGPGLDVRGDGGYVVAPPSEHASGARYRWLPDHTPTAFPAAPPPAWLLDRMTLTVGGTLTRRNSAAPIGVQIPSGSRDVTLTSIAGSMRARGLTPDEILPSLLAVNHGRCLPPLPAADVERIAHSVGRYDNNNIVLVA